MILISACLCGINCKYNGKNNSNPVFEAMLARSEVLPVCPEQLGGLPTPRPACEIVGGTGIEVLEGKARVISNDKQNLSDAFIKGAEEVLHIVKNAGIKGAIFQSRSPSCGCGHIYDGTFSSHLIPGDGVTSALLRKHGIKVINEADFLKLGSDTDL